MKIERFAPDSSGKPCSEGYYAHDGRGVVLMPPTAEMADGLRLATQAEGDTGRIRPANVEDCTNCVANPSDAGA